MDLLNITLQRLILKVITVEIVLILSIKLKKNGFAINRVFGTFIRNFLIAPVALHIVIKMLIIILLLVNLLNMIYTVLFPKMVPVLTPITS